jgi:hypothetical protein
MSSEKTVLLLAVPIRVDDEVDTAIRLRLSAAVVREVGGETLLEQRTGELGASVLETVLII